MSPQLWLQTFYESPLKVSQTWDTSLETSESEHNNNYEIILMFFLFLLQANLALPVQQKNPGADMKPNHSPINTFPTEWISLNAHNSTWLANVLRLTVRAGAPQSAIKAASVSFQGLLYVKIWVKKMLVWHRNQSAPMETLGCCLFLQTKHSLSNWLFPGMERSNLNGNFFRPVFVTSDACSFENSCSTWKLEL